MITQPRPSRPAPAPASAAEEAFLSGLMRRQWLLSVACAASFLAVLLGLPLANYLLPGLMARRVGGFTLSWLALGVLFYPWVWAIAWTFIRRSMALERAEAARARGLSSRWRPSRRRC
jgi:hypothetical protein